ncbi:MAG: sugar transferase [Candidatus Riflebacteria bacterium]|nr:sugar transferase [Candidatus Riflebacteria bacterium]
MSSTEKRKPAKIRGVRLPHGAERLLSLLLVVFDALLMNAVFFGVFTVWFGGLKHADTYLNAYMQIRWWLLGLYCSFGLLAGIFNIRNLSSASDIFSHTSNALLGTFISFNLLAFFSRQMASLAYNFPRPVFLLATAFCVLTAVVLRAIVATLFRPHPLIRRAIIIGDEAEARRIIKHFHRRGGVRFRIVHTMKPEQLEELASEVIFRHAHEVFVTDPSINLDQFWAQIFYNRKEEPHEFKVRIAADYRKTSGTVALQSIEDFPLITLNSHPLTQLQRLCKRAFDVIFSAFALFISSPIMILTALLVRIDSPGPIFYKQKRVGRYGKEFDVIKFRSMRVGSESRSGPKVATADDARISPLGGFLRRFGIDELPQFFLVFTGEMSVVGPRPERPFFVKDYYEFQGRRLSAKPGVTGLAAVNSRYYLRLTDKVTYDYYYLDNYCLVLDIKIVFQTIWVLLFESNKALHDQHHELDGMKKLPADDENRSENHDN